MASIPVLMGYLAIGMAFGLVFYKNGYGAGWALLMSLVVYAGSMQFVAINILAGGLGALEVILMTLAVNLRHVVYGLSLIEKFRSMGAKKPYMIFSLTDETYALLVQDKVPQGVKAENYFFAIALLNQLYWLVGTAIGALAGSLIRFDTTGIDFAMTALFICIATEQWLTFQSRIPAIVGAFATLGSLLLFGAENMLIPAMFIMLAALLLLRPKVEPRLSEAEQPEPQSEKGGERS